MPPPPPTPPPRELLQCRRVSEWAPSRLDYQPPPLSQVGTIVGIGGVSTSEAELEGGVNAQVVRAYNAVEIAECGVRELGYLAVEEGELVLLCTSVGDKGHSRNRYVSYLYAESVRSRDRG